MQTFVVVTGPSGFSRKIPFNGERMFFGRDPSCHLVIDRPGVSPEEGFFVSTDNGIFVCATPNNTLLSDSGHFTKKEVTPSTRVLLSGYTISMEMVEDTQSSMPAIFESPVISEPLPLPHEAWNMASSSGAWGCWVPDGDLSRAKNMKKDVSIITEGDSSVVFSRRSGHAWVTLADGLASLNGDGLGLSPRQMANGVNEVCVGSTHGIFVFGNP